MAEQKTKPTNVSVEEYLDQITDEQVRDDCATLIKLMKKATGSSPKMWGPSIIGFGQYHYKYESGHEGDACLAAFAPRKKNITIYVMPGFTQHEELVQKLGKYKATKGCLHVKRLADIDLKVLEKLVKYSIDYLKKAYPEKQK